jgi:thioredoxin reductase (NADPH)
MLDVIIIGGGPAGFTAALYTARARLDTLLIERAYYGGQMAITNEMENVPGFESVSGSEMADRMVRQAAKFGARMVMEDVLEVRLDAPVKVVKTDKNTYEARTVILCMGASPRKLGLPNEQQLIGSGVSYCATCDGAFFKGMDVAVVGGGDTAAEDVLYLSRFCRRVYLIHRRDMLRAVRVLEDLIVNTCNVTILWDSVVEEILGDLNVTGLGVRNVKTGEKTVLGVSGVFIAIGYAPNTALVKGQVALTDYGYIKTDEKMQTNLDGVYAAGDIREKHLRQVVTAASDGADAAHSAEKYISKM